MLVVVAAAAFNATPAAAQPGFCDDARVMMERYQIFTDDTQAVIDSLSPCKEQS
jgi:hypothetical protein